MTSTTFTTSAPPCTTVSKINNITQETLYNREKWIIAKFTNENLIETHQYLHNHLLRTVSGYHRDIQNHWDWINMYISHARSLAQVGREIHVNKKNVTEMSGILEKEIAFAVYYYIEAPIPYNMPRDYFTKFVNLIWKWKSWIDENMQ